MTTMNVTRLVLKEENPYLGTYYLYPPLPAQIMALFYRCGEETLHGACSERDSSVALLPQNDKRRVQSDSAQKTLWSINI